MIYSTLLIRGKQFARARVQKPKYVYLFGKPWKLKTNYKLLAN